MIQVYTGEGKGKTTAAVGLAVRASKNYKVLFTQVIKSGDSSEIAVLKKLPNINVRTFGNGGRVYPSKKNLSEKRLIEEGLLYIEGHYAKYDIIIIDEAITAITLKLLVEDRLTRVIEKISRGREIILTGHYASKKMIELADLVTEMKSIKHYYDKGIKAREGIEY